MSPDRTHRPATSLFAVAVAALLFLWPALLNRYPIVFSDTGGFLEQALLPDTGWDKPWVYGPFLTPFDAGLTLWPAAYAQCLLLSAALWLTQASLGPPHARRHLALCTILAAGTAAPWFASLLMPDVLAPITVLGLFILARRRVGPVARAVTTLLTTIAIAAHLAHLPLAAACIAVLAFADRHSLRRTIAPLAAALVVLLASNWIAFGRLAISPYGADFALARLVADGPARATIHDACPAAGWRTCAWRDRLPDNADDFLWDPFGPVWADGYGPTRIAPEAAAIVRATLLAHPAAVLAAALRNTLQQLALVQVGDTLVPDHLEVAVLPRLERFFPAAEADRLTASRQYRGKLEALAAPLRPLQTTLLVVATLATLSVAGRWRQDRPRATFAILVLVALLANAAATGALSGPHHRYQARIAWLTLLPPLVAIRRTGSTADEHHPPTRHGKAAPER